jgi:drug/metabolite transporter (DMT)-like permease
MPTKRYVTGPRLWLALGTVYVVWGSTYFGIKVAIETMPPFLMLALRFVVAGGLLVGWEVLRNGRTVLPTRRQVRDSAIVGALLLGVGNGFVALGETKVDSYIAAILVAMMPLWLAVFGWLYFKERLSRLAVAGVGLGLLGVVVLVWPAGGGANAFDLFAIAVLLISPLGWSHGSLFAAHRARLPERPLMASGVQMLAGSVVLLAEGLLTGELPAFDVGAVSVRSLVALVYLISIGSMLGYNAYAWLLRHAPLSLIGTYTYVNPIVAVALGAVFLGEGVSPRTLIAAAVIVGAVAMIVTARGHGGSTDDSERVELAGSPEEAPVDAAHGRALQHDREAAA